MKKLLFSLFYLFLLVPTLWAAAPTATTEDETNVTHKSATLNGTVNANNGSTTVIFEWGTTTAYGNSIDATPGTVTGSTNTAVSAEITGLNSSQTYFYRVVATNSEGTTYGAQGDLYTSSPERPVATTDSAVVTATTATLYGTVDPKDASTVVTFVYSTDYSLSNSVTAEQSPLDGTTPQVVSATISGLTPGTKYYYKVKANNGEEAMVVTKNFTTLPNPPIVTTLDATTSWTDRASLYGRFDHNGGNTETSFEYGLDTNYGSSVSVGTVYTWSGPATRNETVTGLSPNTTYHYRAVGTNAGGTTYGDDVTFTTKADKPIVSDGSASEIGETSAKVSAVVNANNAPTGVTIQIEQSGGGYFVVDAEPDSVFGTSDTPVSKVITGLQPNTTYHYYVYGTNVAGNHYVGGNFKTLATPPTATTSEASAISTSEATLNGTVNANGVNTTVTFEYGPDTGYGTGLNADPHYATGSTTTAVSCAITGLTSGATYHYRVKAVNAGGTTYGDDMTFTASPPPTISIDDVTETEGNSGSVNAEFTVTLSSASNKTVTVDYATANSTATAGSDYTAISSTTLTFNSGETSKTVTVQVSGDALDEENETYYVNLSNPSNATIGDGQGLGTITDDDAAPTLSIDDVTVTEGDVGLVNANFTVSLPAASGKTMTVDYATANNTATAGSDYTAISTTTLTFTPGQTSKTVTVQVLGDAIYELNETYYVNLSNASNATISDGQGLGTITDDDAAPEIFITGDGQVIADEDITPSPSDDTDFENVLQGQNKEHTFTINNPGTANLTLTTPVVLTGSSDFTVTQQPVSPVNPGTSTTFTVRFAPSGTGSRTADISIANNDGDENPYNFRIQGTGVTPEMDLYQVTTAIADGGSFNFGNQASGSDFEVIFTIENTGSGSLSLTTPFTLSGANADQFSIVTQPVSSVAVSGNTTFHVRFSPTSSGAKTATLAIANTDTDENPYNITFTGTAENTTPTATNLTQSHQYNEDTATVPLDDIVVTDPDNGEVMTATLTLDNTATGSLTASSGNGETYTDATGIWTVTGSVPNVNAALAAVAFEPAANNITTSSITTHVQDNAATGPADSTITLTVTPANDPPTATNLTQTHSYTEGDAAVALDDIVITEIDTGDVVTATLILNPTASGQLTTGSGQGETYTGATGVWTLTGTVANVNTALAAVVFKPTADNEKKATITTQIRDLADTGPVNGTITLNVNAINDRPVLIDMEKTALIFNEGDNPIVITDSLNILDVDNTHLEQATIVISENYDATEDTLIYKGAFNCNHDFDPLQGVLTFHGHYRMSEYREILRSVAYCNTDTLTPNTASRTIRFKVYDGTFFSRTKDRTIHILDFNDPPEISGIEEDTLVVVEGFGSVPLSGKIALGDPDNNTFFSARVGITAHYDSTEDRLYVNGNGEASNTNFALQNSASASINSEFDTSTGILTITGKAECDIYRQVLSNVYYQNLDTHNPTPGSRVIEFFINDGQQDSQGAKRIISINAVNDPPSPCVVLSPSENDTIDLSQPVSLCFSPSQDPEGQSITYSLLLIHNQIDTTISLGQDTSYSLVLPIPLSELETIQGCVIADDGELCTPSDTFTVALMSLTTDIEDTDLIPMVFELYPNYPNPFNPTTTIKYALPKSGHVTLMIFNSIGQKIRTLSDNKHQAGYHTIIWDGKDDYGRGVTSGVYIYMIQAENFRQTRKALLLK